MDQEQSNSNHSTLTGSILDNIHEIVTNIDNSRVKRDVREAISNAIIVLAQQESKLRESTITVRMNDSFDHEKIVSIINKEWTVDRKQLPATYWQDKMNTYCEFVSADIKRSFLNMVELEDDFCIKSLIAKPNRSGHHFVRRPVRIEIQGVRSSIASKRVYSSLRASADVNCEISEIREGKLQAKTNNRSLLLSVNAAGFRHLFLGLQGSIPYIDLENKIKARLIFRVNCRPWVCKDCNSLGRHECQGKTCSKCGQKGHSYNECKQRTCFCNNCKRKGHKSRDLDCPTYIRELMKELRKVDIPIEFFQNPDLRFILINSLIRQ